VSKTRPIIAIVDDEECVRKALQRLMRSAGLAVETYAAGADFLQALPEHDPDCVVLDIHMPGLTGFDVLARLADMEPLLPVVIITGHDSPEVQTRALAGGAVAYLRKPINDQTLLDAITDAMAHTPGAGAR
jgi:FixJ family two-component response regulator